MIIAPINQWWWLVLVGFVLAFSFRKAKALKGGELRKGKKRKRHKGQGKQSGVEI